jgi:hypothetical protein
MRCEGSRARVFPGLVVLVACAWSGASGCGLVFNGRTQLVTVRTNPPGAVVSVDGWDTVSPGTVTLSRKRSWVVARAALDGYQPACQVIGAPRNKVFIVLDSIPLAIPLLIDMQTGTLREFPEDVRFTLEPVDPGQNPRRLPPDDQILDAWTKAFWRRTNLCNPNEPAHWPR